MHLNQFPCPLSYLSKFLFLLRSSKGILRGALSLYCCILTFDPAKHAIPKTAEVTHPGRQISEEIAGAWRRVHISVWEFEGNIRPTNWTEESEKIPLFTKAGSVVAPCALSRPSSTYIEESKPHRRTILIHLLTAPTSQKRSSRK